MSCTTKPFYPMVCPKQVIHPDNDKQFINSKMPRGDWEKEGQREGKRDGGTVKTEPELELALELVLESLSRSYPFHRPLLPES